MVFNISRYEDDNGVSCTQIDPVLSGVKGKQLQEHMLVAIAVNCIRDLMLQYGLEGAMEMVSKGVYATKMIRIKPGNTHRS